MRTVSAKFSMCVIFAVWLISSVNSQGESQKHTKVLESLFTNYNASSYDKIYSLYNGSMKKVFSLQTVSDIFSNIKNHYGQYTSLEYIGEKEGRQQYRVYFGKYPLYFEFSLDLFGKMSSQYLYGTESSEYPSFERCLSPLILPFKGEWFTFWGGDTIEQNYHASYTTQKHAFDFIILDTSGKSFKTDGKNNEDYYAFREPVLAPCDAVVVQVIDIFKDNTPGILNNNHPTGNTIVLKTGFNEYIYLCHLAENSISVKIGDEVKQGDIIGLCGNSGNSSEAHLHMHIQNTPRILTGSGIKAYFKNITANKEFYTEYSPVKGQRVSNSQ